MVGSPRLNGLLGRVLALRGAGLRRERRRTGVLKLLERVAQPDMGLERLAMLVYGIDDIRYFYQNDVRFLKQFA